MISPDSLDQLKQIEEADIPAALAAMAGRVGAVRLREAAEGAITASGERPEWAPIIPIGEHSLPPFPVETLPEWLATHVTASAVATQTPPDLAAVLALTALATCVQKKVEVVALPGWIEPVNLYAAVVLGPANRKSAVCSLIAKPIEVYEANELDRLRPDLEEKRATLRVAQSRLAESEKKAGRKTDRSPEAEELLEEVKKIAREVSAIPEPGEYQMLAEDTTPEKLASIMAENGGKMAVLSAEGDTFDIISGRYSLSANLGVYLKSHQGETIIVNRVGRKNERVERPSLTLGMAIQPEVIRGLMAKPTLRGRGLLGRFLYSLPQDYLGWRASNAPPVSHDIKAVYSQGISYLLNLKPSHDDWLREAPHALELSPGAGDALTAYREEVEVELRKDGDLGHIQDWGGKLPGSVVRIAGLLHLADNAVPADDPWYPIQESTMLRAIAIGRYFAAHAQAAFAEMGSDESLSNASLIVAWIERGAKDYIKLSELQQGLKRHFKKAADLELPLQILEERNYIRQEAPTEEERKHNGKGAIRVNPSVFAASGRKADGVSDSRTSAVYPVYPVKDVIVSPNTHSDDTYLLTINGQAGTDGPADNHAPGSVLNGINGLNGALETGSDDDLEDPFQ